MRQNLRASLGAVVLALATLATVIFALINFDQRARFEVVYDGVAWLDTDHGIQASRVLPSSPATRAGIRPGDALLSINSARVTRAAEVAIYTDRKSTRLNSSHSSISYAVFCLKKKKNQAFNVVTQIEDHNKY